MGRCKQHKHTFLDSELILTHKDRKCAPVAPFPPIKLPSQIQCSLAACCQFFPIFFILALQLP